MGVSVTIDVAFSGVARNALKLEAFLRVFFKATCLFLPVVLYVNNVHIDYTYLIHLVVGHW